MDFDALDRIDPAVLRRAVREFVAAATSPAFGSLPQRELNLLIFDLLRHTGVLSSSASTYDLMTSLKITRARARAILFDIDIRDTARMANLDHEAKDALSRPQSYVVDGTYITFAVENPLVQAHIQNKVRTAGHFTDTSFDSSLVRLKPAALGSLIEALLTPAERDVYDQSMKDAGLKQDKSLATAITAGLKHLSTKYLGKETTEIASGYIEDFGKFLTPLASAAKDKLVEAFRGVVADQKAADLLKPAKG